LDEAYLWAAVRYVERKGDVLILIINASPGSVLQELFGGAGIEGDPPPLTIPLPIKVAFSALYHS
jgi:hypothetical protein